ncbi:MAG: glycosyltransferase family 39 protein [Pseudorhodoplanes sp.]
MIVSDRSLDRLAIGVLAIVAGIAAFTFRDYGLGWDDLTHAQYGQLLLNLYTSGFSDARALSFVNLYMYGGGFDMGAALLSKILPIDLFETRRLFGAIVGLIGLAVTWRLARRIGGPLAGLLALILLATTPHYYGHMFINPKDTPFAIAVAILLIGLVRVIEDYPRPRAPAIGLVGLGVGLSIGSRILGLITGLYVIVPFLILIGADIRRAGMHPALRNLGLCVARLMLALLLSIPIIALIWPWVATEPLNIVRAAGYFSHFFEKPWREMYEGNLIPVPDMPRGYVPKLFVLKTPELFLALIFGAVAGTLTAIFNPRTQTRRRAILALILGAATLPILIAFITRPAMYNGIRHFVFVFPPLAVLGGLAGAWVIEKLRGMPKPALFAAGCVALVGIASPIASMIRLHPYQYTHFNWLAGGIYDAEARFMLDYWGLAFKEASQALRTKLAETGEKPAHPGRWRIAVCGPHAPAEVELGPEFRLTWDPRGADFALMLGEFYCAELNAPLMVEVEREDVVFARVYDIRGHDITSLFTVAPLTR